MEIFSRTFQLDVNITLLHREGPREGVISSPAGKGVLSSPVRLISTPLGVGDLSVGGVKGSLNPECRESTDLINQLPIPTYQVRPQLTMLIVRDSPSYGVETHENFLGYDADNDKSCPEVAGSGFPFPAILSHVSLTSDWSELDQNL